MCFLLFIVLLAVFFYFFSFFILFCFCFFFFFFQAEDGIRDHCVTGVQTCALPISCGVAVRAISAGRPAPLPALWDRQVERACRLRRSRPSRRGHPRAWRRRACAKQIGRASCRERVEISVRAVALKREE